MYIHSVYCAIRDRDVCVAMSEKAHAGQKDLAIICMKYSYGPICTGDFCPNFGKGGVGLGIRPALNCPAG